VLDRAELTAQVHHRQPDRIVGHDAIVCRRPRRCGVESAVPLITEFWEQLGLQQIE
jgi:hypothetical protein